MNPIFVLLLCFYSLILLEAGCLGEQSKPSFEPGVRPQKFSGPIDKGEVASLELDEASGIAVSRSNPAFIWSHNDSGDKNRLFLMDSIGAHKAVFYIKGARNRDWEDIAIGPGPKEGVNYLYIADIGDNNSRHDIKRVYRIKEPNLKGLKFPLDTTIKGIETINLVYPDGNRDAETLLLDPLTKDLYIVTKREPMVHVYLARYPQSTKSTTLMEQVAVLDLSLATGGDISSDGSEILIKTYQDVYYWKRKGQEPLSETFKREPKRLPYEAEPAGEAIAWKVDGSGFFTLSERVGEPLPRLYLYKRD